MKCNHKNFLGEFKSSDGLVVEVRVIRKKKNWIRLNIDNVSTKRQDGREINNRALGQILLLYHQYWDKYFAKRDKRPTWCFDKLMECWFDLEVADLAAWIFLIRTLCESNAPLDEYSIIKFCDYTDLDFDSYYSDYKLNIQYNRI